MGYRFVNIDMSQIGSVVYFDLLMREDILHRQTPKNKIFVLASHHTDGNAHLMNLYDRYCVYVRNPFIKLLLTPFFLSPVFQDNSYHYDFVYHTKTVAHKIWEKYLDTFNEPLIHLPEQDIEKCQRDIERYIPGFSEGHVKFVSLHVRDSGFYGDTSRTSRNADILTYRAAIQYLISKGYAVIRMGDQSAVSVSGMVDEFGPMLFDYAHSDIRSECLDCFLLSECEFFIGLASGPSSVPMLFGTSSCNVNWYNVSNGTNFMPGDLTSFKTFRYKKDNALVPLADLMYPPFSLNAKEGELDNLGVYVENNSEQQILDTVKEFVETPRDQTSELQQKAKSLILKKNYGFGAKGNFSNTILKLYEDELLKQS